MEPAPHPLERLMGEKQIRPAVLAVACNVDQSTVHRWKKGRSVIPSDKLRPLADALGVSVEALLPAQPEEAAA